MISIKEEVTIPSPPRRVWPMLCDPTLVASCIPGATLTASGEGGAYQGTMRVKFGPTIAIFRGEAKLAYDDSEQRCTIEGRGIDGRGASRALASGVVTASGRRVNGAAATATVLRVEGNFNVTGPLETFANAGGVHLARAILAEFAGNMARLAAERVATEPEPDAEEPDEADSSSTPAAAGQRSGSASAPHPVPAGATELHGGALLWRAFFGWLRQLFSFKGITGKGKTE